MCYNQRCQDIRSIKVFGTKDCSAKCSNHGVRCSLWPYLTFGRTSGKQMGCDTFWGISCRSATTRANVTVTPAGRPLSAICWCQRCPKVLCTLRSENLFISLPECLRLCVQRSCTWLLASVPPLSHFSALIDFSWTRKTTVLCLLSTSWQWFTGIPPLVMK